MAKSKIIKELANGVINTTTALKRAKVLFSELKNETLLNWVNYEISGYPENNPLPDYRILSGKLMGSYFKGSMASHMKWNNVSIPLGNMPEDVVDKLLSVPLYEGVDALIHLIQQNEKAEGNVGKIIPADLFSAISFYNNDPYMIITSAQVIVGSHHVTNIITTIENKLLDALILLENEFGNLDELDIDTSTKTAEEISKLTKELIVIIYNDQSVNIGDGNRIKDSNIASLIEK